MRKERESSRSRNYSGFAQGAIWHWKSCFSPAQRSPRWAVFLSSSPGYWVSVAGCEPHHLNARGRLDGASLPLWGNDLLPIRLCRQKPGPKAPASNKHAKGSKLASDRQVVLPAMAGYTRQVLAPIGGTLATAARRRPHGPEPSRWGPAGRQSGQDFKTKSQAAAAEANCSLRFFKLA